MNKFICTTTVAIFLSLNAYAEEKMDFGMCSADLKTHCTASQDEHAKHDCLSKLDESKLSQSCRDHRKKMMSQADGKNSDEHKGHKH